MTDDPAARLLALREELRAKATWMLQTGARVNGASGKLTQQQYDEAKRAAGFDPSPEPTQPDPEPDPPPGDGGARAGQPTPPTGDAEGILRRIADAEQAGDYDGAMAAKSALLRLRADQMNNPNNT